MGELLILVPEFLFIFLREVVQEFLKLLLVGFNEPNIIGVVGVLGTISCNSDSISIYLSKNVVYNQEEEKG